MGQSKRKHQTAVILSVLFWIAIWQILSTVIDQEILLVSPFTVVRRTAQLICTGDFWISIVTSMGRILLGFTAGLLLASLCAVLSARFSWFKILLKPFVFTVKAIPVASFIILILIWVKAKDLSAVISFLMVFPILYENILKGIESTDQKLLEMADIFGIHGWTRIREIYFSQVIPYLEAGCSLALGLAWKSGIAAEVIGLPDASIGEHLYEAKVYLDTPDLFAWTFVIILLSILFQKVFMFLLHQLLGKAERER
jgi:NitT/TauT family transport system permease protein